MVNLLTYFLRKTSTFRNVVHLQSDIRKLTLTSSFHLNRNVSLRWKSNFSKRSSSKEDQQTKKDVDYEDFAQWTREIYKIPGMGHRVLVVQPDCKWIPKKTQKTTPELQLAEAVALAETLPNWKVIDKLILTVKEPNKKLIFSSGILETLKERVSTCVMCKGITAVFFSLNMLSGLQHSEMEELLGLPVYDRYTVVLRIFHDHAKTTEAKLQVALAEIPYFRSRIRGILRGKNGRGGGNTDERSEGLSSLFCGSSGSFRQKNAGKGRGIGETFLEARKRILNEMETKLKKSLEELKSQRGVLRVNRTRKEFATVAVVGYTNSGKTSIIKALTNEATLQPKDQLFATLDVTVHCGYLENRMKVLYIDTVGFISDIPTDLVTAFAATLEEVLLSDVVVHVCDVSHPDYEAQKETVRLTLKNLNVEDKLLETMIEIDNKMDLLPSNSESGTDNNALKVSVVTGLGLSDLKYLIEERLLQSENRKVVTVRVPTGGKEAKWLYKEANVMNSASDSDPEFSIFQAIMTKSVLSKFRHTFGNLEI